MDPTVILGFENDTYILGGRNKEVIQSQHIRFFTIINQYATILDYLITKLRLGVDLLIMFKVD